MWLVLAALTSLWRNLRFYNSPSAWIPALVGVNVTGIESVAPLASVAGMPGVAAPSVNWLEVELAP